MILENEKTKLYGVFVPRLCTFFGSKFDDLFGPGFNVYSKIVNVFIL